MGLGKRRVTTFTETFDINIQSLVKVLLVLQLKHVRSDRQKCVNIQSLTKVLLQLKHVMAFHDLVSAKTAFAVEVIAACMYCLRKLKIEALIFPLLLKQFISPHISLLVLVTSL